MYSCEGKVMQKLFCELAVWMALEVAGLIRLGRTLSQAERVEIER